MKELFQSNQLSHFLPSNNNFSGRSLKIEGGGGGGQHRYGCAVSTKPRPGKISQENLMNVWAKSAQKLNDWTSFHEL